MSCASEVSDDELVREQAPVNCADRVTTRTWELDLSLAGKVYTPKKRIRRLWRQRIAKFVGREGTIERFEFRQTIPYCGYEVECPPSQAQYGAVCDFYVESCETRSQAKTLLSAREYAELVADGYSFTAPRKRLIALCIAAFILSDRERRSIVKSWSIARWSGRITGFGHARTYRVVNKKVHTFAERLVNDMRREGAEIFG
jgi:hypothetical protein